MKRKRGDIELTIIMENYQPQEYMKTEKNKENGSRIGQTEI
ncbi:hypothetical protein [Labilibaculum euxinus]